VRSHDPTGHFLPLPMNLLSCIGLVANIDPNGHSNSRAQHRPGELIVVGSGYYLSTILGMTRRQLNLTLADAQHMNSGIHGIRKRAEAGARSGEPRQLQESPASEQAG
jgi:hypothetical protein